MNIPSAGWKNLRNGTDLKYLKINGEKASADEEAAANYIYEFGQIVIDANLTSEQVCNADETSLFRRHCPRKIWTTDDETAPMGIKDPKDWITVGMRKCSWYP